MRICATNSSIFILCLHTIPKSFLNWWLWNDEQI
nr:MAG TPA: hypothetical protein [Caudoviricetes sp.]